MNRRIWFSLPWLILIIGVSSAYIIISNGPKIVRQTPQISLPRVEVIEVTPTTLRIDIKSRGIVKPLVEMKLVSEVSGRVINMTPGFKVGSFFNKYEVLVTIDSGDQNYAILDATAQVAAAQTSLLAEQAKAARAREGWIFKGKVKATPLALREPHLIEASAKLDAVKGILAKAYLAKDKTKLRAYFNGLVGEKLVNIGQYVGEGETLATLLSTATAEIRLPLSQDQLAHIDLPLLFGHDVDKQKHPKVSLQAQIAGETRHWQGTIVATEGIIDEETRQLYIVAQVEDPYNLEGRPDTVPLLTGLFVQAIIQGKVLQNVFALPHNSLYGKHQVIIVENERIHLHKVEVLQLELDRVIVRGIHAGQQVVSHRMENVVNGMRVEVIGKSN